MRTAIITLVSTMAISSPACANGTLLGIPVTLQVLTYDTPETLIFESDTATSIVSDAREFNIGPGAEQNKLNVVPFVLDITNNRAELIYQVPSPGDLHDARFNGYVLDFASACPALVSAQVDTDFTDLGVSNKRVRVDGNRLTINVSGMTYLPSSKIGINLKVADCAGPVQTSGKKSN